MSEMNEELKIISVVPRCSVCGATTHYWIKNKKTGETKFFCSLCGELGIFKYHNDDWDIICLG